MATLPDPANVTWTVDPNQLVSNQITGLLSSNNPYITGARAQGTQQAAGRGFLNGTMAAGAAENAAVQGALPIASQDAGTFAHAAQSNAEGASQREIGQRNNSASITVAGIGAGASMYGDDKRAKTSADALAQAAEQYNANWQQDQTRNDWQGQRDARMEGYATQNAVTGSILGTLMSDPSYWADGAGSTGMANFYNKNFSDIFGEGTKYTPTEHVTNGVIPIPTYSP